MESRKMVLMNLLTYSNGDTDIGNGLTDKDRGEEEEGAAPCQLVPDTPS